MALTVSDAWKQAIGNQFREPGHLQFGVKVVPPGLEAGQSVSSTDTDPDCDASRIINGVTTAPTRYATLEPLRWHLDGTSTLLTHDTVPDDWWSDVFDSDTKTLHFTFDAAYTIPGMWAQWDVLDGTYPTSVTLIGYNVSHVQTYSFAITPTAVEEFLSAAMENVKYVDVVINSWSTPSWRARVNAVVFGALLNLSTKDSYNRIAKASSSRSTDLLASELFSSTFNIELQNYDKFFDPNLVTGLSKYLKVGQLAHSKWGFEVTKGNIEWLAQQNAYISKVEIPASQQNVSIELSSRFSFMTSNFYYGTYSATARTFMTVALELLQGCSMLKETEDSAPWALSSVLSGITTKAPLPAQAANVLLDYIAGACGCYVDTAVDTDHIRVRSTFNDLSGRTISQANTTDYPSIVVSDVVRRIYVNVYQYTVSATASQIAQVSYFINGTVTMRVDFSGAASDVSIVVTGAAVNSQTLYANCAVLSLTAAGATVTITATGKSISSSSTLVTAYDNTTITSGIEVTIDNPLVTEVASVSAIVTAVLNYYAPKQHITQKYQGYPELEVGDKPTYTNDHGTYTLPITGASIEYNGAFNGTLKLNGGGTE